MSDVYIGDIRLFPYYASTGPIGWAYCEGQLLSIAQNTALFSLIGTTYGGNGQTTFGLPDLRGRVPIHAGQGPGLSNYSVGSRAGASSVSLTNNDLPPHTHNLSGFVGLGLNVNSDIADLDNPNGNFYGALDEGALYHSTANANMANVSTNLTVNTANTGSGVAHENRQPYLVMRYAIALQGLFPSFS